MKHLVSKEAMHLFCLSWGLTRREKWLLSWRHLKFNFTAVALETLHLAILQLFFTAWDSCDSLRRSLTC